MKRAAPALTALLLVTACGDEAAAPEDLAAVEQGGEVSGDVQEGSISDAMIPLEALRSQSPPLERSASTSGANDSSDDPAGSQSASAAQPSPGDDGESPAGGIEPASAPPSSETDEG